MLTDEEARAVTRLRGIRNEVVHAPVVMLNTDSVVEYIKLLRQITSMLTTRMLDRWGAPAR